MTVKKEKGGHKCSWCDAKAVWRSAGLTFPKYSCLAHEADLRLYEKDNTDDGYMSMGDEMSWGKL